MYFVFTWEFNLLLSCFGLLALHVLGAYTETVDQPAGLASLNSGTGTVLYGRGQLGSIWVKTSRLPVLSDLAVLFIYEYKYNFIWPEKTWLYMVKAGAGSFCAGQRYVVRKTSEDGCW